MNLPSPFIMKDGRRVIIRSLVENDASLLVEMYHQLSETTRKLRFHTIPPNISEERIWKEAVVLSRLNPELQAAVVATTPDGTAITGVARLGRATATDPEAEIAVVVRDDYQNAGLGKHLLFTLGEIAREMEIEEFNAWVLTENQQVLRLISNLDIPVKLISSRGETHISVQIDD